MLRIDTNKATFPLLLSFNFAVSTPLSLKGILYIIYENENIEKLSITYKRNMKFDILKFS